MTRAARVVGAPRPRSGAGRAARARRDHRARCRLAGGVVRGRGPGDRGRLVDRATPRSGRPRRVPRRRLSLPALVGDGGPARRGRGQPRRAATRDRETGAPSARASSGAHPNVLLVVIDTLRADHLELLRLCARRRARRSTRSPRAARSSRTRTRCRAGRSRRRASLVTGPLADGAPDAVEEARLPDTEVTIAERLRARGLSDGAPLGQSVGHAEYGFDQGVDDYFSAYDERFARVTLLMQALRRAVGRERRAASGSTTA